MSKFPKSDRAIEYIAKFPKRGNMTIAKILIEDFPELYANVEDARSSVRYARGAGGDLKRKKRKLEKNMTPHFHIPEDDNVDYEPYVIDNNCRSGIILSDIHFPYHDKRALDVAIDYTQQVKPDFILLNGDILDMHSLSFFERDPTKRNIDEEFEMLKNFLSELRRHFPRTKIIYKIANHEERWDRYLMQHAPQMYRIEELRFEGMMNFDEYKIDCVDRKRVITYRELNIIHGHEYRFSISNPVNPARGVFLRTHKSTLSGHFHQVSEHTEPTIAGDTTTCWSTGALCGLHPQWLPLNKWGHGFAEITGLKDGLWRVKNHRIIDGVMV